MDISSIVAGNLKRLRESKNLSLDRAAKLTGVSKSMLGQIERNEVTPTITVLWKIANGFKIPFTLLTSEEPRAASVIRAGDITPLTEDDGRYINHPVFPFTEGRPFEICRITVKPGGRLDAEPHLPGTEEFITVFCGQLRVIADEREYCLSKGDSIRFRADAPHSYANPGAEDVELAMTIYYS